MKKLFGFSLVEVFISLSLTLIVVSGLVTLLLALQKTVLAHNTRYELQTNALLASAILQQAIHHAGYTGCAKLTADLPIYNTTDLGFDLPNSLQILGKNTLAVSYASPDEAGLINAMHGYSTLHTSLGITVDPGDYLLIEDCRAIDIFQVKKISRQDDYQTLLTHRPLSHLYNTSAVVHKIIRETLFIANTNRMNHGHAIYSLYKQDQQGLTELVIGIDKMVLHGTLHNQQLSGIAIQLKLTAGMASKDWYLYVAKRN